MTGNGIKLIISAAFAALAAYCKELLGPLVLVGIAMLCDYASGVAAAWVNKELSSRVGAVGFVKKVCLALLIVAGILVDWVIRIAAGHMGLEVPAFCLFGVLVAIWIIVNEIISIIENIARMGVDVPHFLEVVIEKLKAATEEKGEEYTGGERRE